LNGRTVSAALAVRLGFGVGLFCIGKGRFKVLENTEKRKTSHE
jgi:hypothetical protein